MATTGWLSLRVNPINMIPKEPGADMMDAADGNA
jgi:hypothetical protein